MKKVVVIFAIFISITSCSVDDDTTPQTTSVVVSTGNEFAASTTDKNVQRGSLFAWISEIQIKAAHESGYISTTNFTLVDNGTFGAGTQFIMDDVHLGNNTFTATSKTIEPERLETNQFPRPNGSTSATNKDIINQFSTLNARNPYAVYTSTNPVNSTIVQGIAQEINIAMNTENSRIIAMFATDDIHGNNTDNEVTITCYVNGVSFGPTAICNSSMNATYYWSDRNSLAGKTVSFKIINNDKGVLDTYDTPSIVIKASNTFKMLYIIKDKMLVSTPM